MKKWKGIIMMGGKHTMKNQWKRSAVVATVLVFVCAAVYLNWRYAGNVAEQAAANQGTEQQVLEQENGESTKVLGDGPPGWGARGGPPPPPPPPPRAL